MRKSFLLLSISLLSLCGCAYASGEVAGGDPLFDAATPLASDAGVEGAATWTALYTDYFGPTGKANCSSLSTSCHTSTSDTGGGTSGFLCITSKDSCWQSMTMGTGCDEAGVVMPCPIVPTGGTQDPTTTGLYKNLHKTDGTGNMPLYGATAKTKGYVFTPTDVARITQWIKEGAQDN
jgi:hypothetical protein